MEKKDKKTPFIFYYYLHSKIKELSKDGEISKKDIKSYLHHWRIPKNLRPIITKELEMLGLLSPNGKWYYKINECPKEKLDLHLVYESLGIW